MYMTKVLTLLLVLQYCELCLTIKVPVVWDNGADSDLNENEDNNQQEAHEPTKPRNVQNPIPVEYFEYNAPKPQFAIEVAKFHGVPNPEQHYRAYPIKPYTNKDPPQFGIHHMLDEDKKVFQPYQQYLNKNDGIRTHAKPASTEYEIFHPYKAEEPALQAIYKDPVLAKIRTDLEDNKNRLQNYEKEAGKPHITKNEYLESPEETDRKLFPQHNVPAPYEIHRPERRPLYYKAPIRYNHRENVLNQKFRHPLNQNYVKIRPVHYRPLKNHLQQLKQHQAIKYDDERNEYPQVHPAEYNEEPGEGYDIYEKGREKYTQLRNNVDESINKAVKENQPVVYQRLELQNDETKGENNGNNDDEEEFVPVKNYAQVRKTEVTKHLPREAAFDDAETLEEILNAPRLREAVKSKKAQTVYTEEGYEDAAYDHAGEHKHASEHEGHGGYLKENQLSGGLYKIPSVSSKYEDGKGSEYQDKTLHGEKWKNNKKEEEEEKEDEDYSEIENEQYVGAKSYNEETPNNANYRNKREGSSSVNNDPIALTENETNTQHEVDKREVNFKVPEFNFTSTFLTEAEIMELAKQKLKPRKNELKEKYPYYYKSHKGIHKNSPLRYAENFKFIPKKSDGGTEFYDSRSKLECPEVENVDPLPEKLKNDGNPTEDKSDLDQTGAKSNRDGNFETVKNQPRLKGLGDKIDCFKAKYFGENPLDSPFFKEDVISNPEPISAPKFAAYKLATVEQTNEAPKINRIFDDYEKYKDDKTDVFVLLDKFRTDQNKIHEPLIKKNEELTKSLYTSPATSANNTHLSNVYNDVIENIKNNIETAQKQTNAEAFEKLLNSNKTAPNVTYNYYQNKEDVTKPPQNLRRKRATSFVYEPYKIIRDGQVQDSKKTTTSGNVSPLIKQLQSSRVADRVNKSNQENEKQVKRNANTRAYVDIGKKDREKATAKGNTNSEKAIVDVSIDTRRGEPRYEIRSAANHKLEYTPVENKKSMSVEDYKAQTTTKYPAEQSTVKKENDYTTQKPTRTIQRTRIRKTTARPVYDVSQFIPKPSEIQNVAASNTVRKTVTTSAPKAETKIVRSKKEPKVEVSREEEYGEYEDEEIATTTTKPSFRRRIKTTSTTTEKPQEEEEEVTKSELPKLRLITRFRNTPTEKSKVKIEITEKPTVKTYDEEYDIALPKYREKKTKSSTSTIVTDTKKYGDEEEDDDMRREEVDALIGVTESLDDYIPMYEKEARERRIQNQSDHDDEDDDSSDDDSDDDNDEEEDDDEEEDSDEENEEEEEPEIKMTTPEPTKRTLVRTTDAPTPTIASRSEKLQNKPIVTKKKIEIHKETPVNKSSPHVSQFKQDIKEVEIIKEIPSVSKRKPQKNAEVLELYKDDSLAEDVNKLGDVEIFSENIDLDKGPKHGGNYRVATKEDIKQLAELSKPKDAVASQSENTKHIELDEYAPKKMHGGNLKSISDLQRSRQRGRNSRLVELRDPPVRGMHGGNLRYGHKGRRGGRQNDKLIEADDDKEDNGDQNSSSREDSFKPFNTRHDRMHGGNYRSAKLVQAPESATEVGKKVARKDARKNGAGLLSSFAQAVPILTTTPGYILDPSKRMYYYVD